MNTILHGDCISGMNALGAGSVDLVFADPPFNIGYDYDVYRDELSQNQYLNWSRQWIGAVHRILKENGTFWLAIGDEYAAELKVASQEIGFHCRSWVVWYYTFGVNCKYKFTRSHAHLFYFVKDPAKFVFRSDDPDNRIPSARQLVYNDNRANPRGRLPDDTWIIPPADATGALSVDDDLLLDVAPPSDESSTWTLRPQDLQDRFRPDEDTWYFPRVAGTFKERAGFHGCQMPEQLLGRIIRSCTDPDALVLDPFSGSGTTTAVAKKLSRRYLAFDLSEDYVRQGLARLESIRVGDLLDGSAEPLASAPTTAEGRAGQQEATKRRNAANAGAGVRSSHDGAAERQLEHTLQGIIAAFAATHAGCSVDRMVVDPDRNVQFTAACRERSLAGDPRSWNMLLFRLRKGGKLAHLDTVERTRLSWEECDPYLFASEIAWRMLLDDERAVSLDEILCDPYLAAEFDAIAGRLAPGYRPLEYRLAALKLRKQSKLARVRAASLSPPARLGKPTPLGEFEPAVVPAGSGVYLIGTPKSGRLYLGETVNLRRRLSQFDDARRELWREHAERVGIAPDKLNVWVRPVIAEASEMLAWQACLAHRFQPRLNLFSQSVGVEC